MIGFVNKWTVVDMLTALENEFQRHKPFSDTENAMYWRLCEIEGDIGKLPSADLEEVVRCGDCNNRNDEEKCPMCHIEYKTMFNYKTDDNGFCHKWERRADNE